MHNKKEKNSAQNWADGFIKYGLDNGYIKPPKKEKKQTVEDYLLKGEKEERFLISDVATHGCSGGTISDLIYYEDTVKFYNDHEAEIWEELSNMAEDLGQTIPFMISNFRGCKNVSNAETFKNLLAWWICEHIAARISDQREDGKRSCA